jgi:hypothetical protein
MYRMLGRERQADLEREAARHALVALLQARPPLTQRAAASLRRIATRLELMMTRRLHPEPASAREPAAP